jgi:5-methylcytosine-specific restriction endonuclease McrA
VKPKCFYCHCKVYRYKTPAGRIQPLNTLTKDHLVPKCRGGQSTPENKVISCLRCNVEKGQLTVGEYMAVLEFRKGNYERDCSTKMVSLQQSS